MPEVAPTMIAFFIKNSAKNFCVKILFFPEI